MIDARRTRVLGLFVVLVLTAAASGRDADVRPARTGLPDSFDTTTAPVAGSGGAGSDGDAPATSPTELTLVAENIAFDTETLAAPAGVEVTIEYDNRDGVPHNLHIVTEDGDGPRDRDRDGPVTQRLTFTIAAPGSYTYVCDVHPQQMTGTLEVS